VANYLVLTRSTRTSPPPRSSRRPRGRLRLPIFIPQGWPPAMSHLSGFCPGACFPRIAPATCATMYRWRPLRTARFRWRVDQMWTASRPRPAPPDREGSRARRQHRTRTVQPMGPTRSSTSGRTGTASRSAGLNSWAGRRLHDTCRQPTAAIYTRRDYRRRDPLLAYACRLPSRA
jgi:hypothetical protein